jgi:hypothetical protein
MKFDEGQSFLSSLSSFLQFSFSSLVHPLIIPSLLFLKVKTAAHLHSHIPLSILYLLLPFFSPIYLSYPIMCSSYPHSSPLPSSGRR